MKDFGPPTEVCGKSWLQRIARFRVEVWRSDGLIDERFFPAGSCLEPIDRVAKHIVIRAEDSLIAAIRYSQYTGLDDCPLARQYLQSGLTLDGAIAVPERLVVAQEFRRRGILRMLANTMVSMGLEQGVSWMISECSPATAELLRRRGRKSLGYSDHDPRFPKTRFEFMLTDIDSIRAGLAHGPGASV